ncbi:MAG: cupredoxin domain-containing protein [Gemmatimonadota bacterium]
MFGKTLRLIILTAMCLAACDSGGGGATDPAPPAGGPTGPGGGADDDDESGPRTIDVTMQGIAFNAPGGGDFVTIRLGESVRWVNRDGTLHTATSTVVPPGGKPFHSGHLRPGDTHTFRPSVTGTWEYHCERFPDRMTQARITVHP